MKHFNKLLLISIFLPFLSAAQSNYKPGYVVNLKGDTIRGLIDYQGWDSNPAAIFFKSSVSDNDKKTFTTGDINLFNVNGLATYKKYVCAISMDATNTMHLGEGRDTSFKVDTVFLQVLQQGKNLALYAYTDNTKTRFYIGEASGYKPTELIYRIYYDVSAKTRTVNENTYQKQLFALANKYGSLDDKLISMLENQFMTYSKTDLLAVVSRINNISKVEFERKYTEHSKVSWYVDAALNISSITSPEASSFTAGGGKPSTSYLPVVAVGINLVPNPSIGRVEFRMELSLADARFNSMYQLKVSPYTGAQASFNQLGISLGPEAIFNFYNAPNFKFYGGVGILVTYSNYISPVFESQPAGNQFFPVEPYYFNRLDNAFVFKLGFQFNKKFEIYGDYLTSTTVANSGYFQLNETNMHIGLVYLLGK